MSATASPSAASSADVPPPPTRTLVQQAPGLLLWGGVILFLAIAYKPQSCELVSLFMDVAREVLAAKRTRAKHPRLRRAARTPKLASA